MQSPDRADESGSLSTSSTEPLNAPGALQELEGQFAFMTVVKETFLTAVGGGGRTTDTVHTDAIVPGSWEMFRLWTTSASEFYGIQTLNGHFVTAVDAGGRTTDTIHTDARGSPAGNSSPLSRCSTHRAVSALKPVGVSF